MAFELLIQAKSISGDGKNLVIEDVSDWSQSLRANYALLTYADYVASDFHEDALEVINVDPEIDAEWSVAVTQDGRVDVQTFGWLKAVSTDLANEGDVKYITDRDLVQQYIAGEWTEITPEEEKAGAAYTSNLLNLNVLVNAIEYQQQLNLQYITQVKSDLAHGAQQNELYYKRTDLDYVSSLIKGAEYNFGLGLYTIYYDIVENLNSIVSTGKIS